MDRLPSPFVRTRLSVMMFLFFFSVGAWAVTLSTYLMSAPTRGGLNFTTAEVGWIYSTFAFGGMLAPLVIGLLADRLFAAERVLGVTGLLFALLLFVAGRHCDAHYPRADESYRRAAAAEGVLDQIGRADVTPEVRAALDRVNDDPTVRATAAAAFRPLFTLMLAYCVCLQIGLTLTTVITLRNVVDPGEFSRTRLFGTVGWIVAGNAVGLVLVAVSPQPLYLASAAALALGLYAFTLPHTPPRGAGRSPAEALGLPALGMFKDRSFGVFVGVAFTGTAMNQFYAVYAHRYLTDLGVPNPASVMTLGQVVEMACMFAIPVLGPTRRMKLLMTLGLLGWVARGAALASGSAAAAVAVGVTMHGWSYAFFHVVAATYLDREAPPRLRASAQGVLTFVTGGVGVWTGNALAGWVVDRHRIGTLIDWPPVWTVPLLVCSVALVAFLMYFKPPTALRVDRPD